LWWYERMSRGQSTAAWHRTSAGDGQEPLALGKAPDDRRGWLILAALFLVGGIVGPDSFGPEHGEFLPQRLLLLGFVALVPVFDADLSRRTGKFLLAVIVVAVSLQAAIVWDYAIYSNATAGQIIKAGKLVGRDQRVVTLLVSSRGRFRANPLLHAEDWLGVDTGNVIWNNYEAVHYYFPVQFRRVFEGPHPGDLERISIDEDTENKAGRLRDWEDVLTTHASSIDVVLFWKNDPELETITKRWFAAEQQMGAVRVYRRARKPP
jgi:hypothetical protein